MRQRKGPGWRDDDNVVRQLVAIPGELNQSLPQRRRNFPFTYMSATSFVPRSRSLPKPVSAHACHDLAALAHEPTASGTPHPALSPRVQRRDLPPLPPPPPPSTWDASVSAVLTRISAREVAPGPALLATSAPSPPFGRCFFEGG